MHHVCLLDAAFVSLYIWLIELALLSLALPFLRNVSAHGKLRQQHGHGAVEKKRDFFSLDNFAQGEAFLVEKSRFRYFYPIGLISLVCCIALGNCTANLDAGCLPSTSSLVLLATHLVRRAYECFFVHQWRKGSKTHLLGFILGAGHYIWLPMIFIKLPCRNFRCNLLHRWHMGEKMDSLAYFYTLLHHVPIWFFFIDPKCEQSSVRPNAQRSLADDRHASLSLRASVFGACLWAQYQQWRHHVLLANLRKTNLSSEKEKKKNKSAYSLPLGGWFQYVACPHYLAEILIYVCFAVLLAMEPRERLPLGNRHWLILVFVVINLSLSAGRSQEWYRTSIPDYDKLRRKAIIPFLF